MNRNFVSRIRISAPFGGSNQFKCKHSKMNFNIQSFLLMTWIFQQCKDQLGHCIRQYVFFALSIVLSVLALYSFIKTFKSQNRFTFEVLPLAINSFTSVIIIGIYSQITFCCIILFILHLVLWVHDYGDEAKRQIRIDIEVNDSLYSRVKCIFVVITVVCVIVVAALIVLGVLDKLQCNEDQGIGAIIMLLLQLPLIALTYYFSHKCKRLLQKQSTFHRKEQLSPSIVTKHLMIQEDLYIKLKKLQLNLVRIALFITFALHITQILSFYIADSGRICRGNSLVVTTQLEIFILSVQNVTELFPHLIIPIIFWYIPFKINARSQTVFISQQQQITNSKFDQQYPRRHQEPKLKMESGDRQQSEFYKNMHSQQSIRDKLIPKTKTQRTSTL